MKRPRGARSDVKIQILLVENDPEIIAEIQTLFSTISNNELKVLSFQDPLLEKLSEDPVDLVLMAHSEHSSQLLTKIINQHPAVFTMALLPTVNEDWINEYIKVGVNGLIFKDRNFISDLSAAVTKAANRIIERKSVLLASESSVRFLTSGNRSERDLFHGRAVHSGQTLMHYQILEELGEGGMGEVYSAKDTRLGRKVAIKLLPLRVTKNALAQKRLIREARSASALNHPNIITIYSVEETKNLSFIVMEYVEGQSLHHILRQGPLELVPLLDIGIQVADALAAAHGAGVIHRDIKPGNIMVTEHQKVKLLDFGLAKWVPSLSSSPGAESEAQQNDLTGVGIPVGTISYMSPEQTLGEELDSRTDIFSLGCVLYEGATGKLPFQGASLYSVMHEITRGEAIAPSNILPSLPPAFDRILALAMAKKKTARYGSAAEFAELMRLLKGALTHKISDSTFQVALARLMIDRNSAAQVSINSVKAKTIETDIPVEKIRRWRVLLVEDNDDNRDMLKRRLERKGFEVLTAVDGEEALSKTEQEMPDLILMDINLPLLDGHEVIRRLKTDEKTKQIPIITLTAHAMSEDRNKALAAGSDDFDTKPVEFDRLVERIRKWLRKRG